MTRNYLVLLFSILITGCSGYYNIKDGHEAFEQRRYALSAELLQEDFAKAKNDQQRYELALKIGQAYENFADFTTALEWYETAVDLEVSEEINTDYISLLKQNEQYEKAISELNKMLKRDPNATSLGE